jgi:dihydrofolate reductase
MSNVIADISRSLHGYVTGPGADLEHGLGRGGEAVQQGVSASHDSPEDRAFLEEAEGSTGAVVMGRRTFDFVVTHQVPAQTRHRRGFTFISDGIESTVSQARDTAGEKEVVITPNPTHLTYQIETKRKTP